MSSSAAPKKTAAKKATTTAAAVPVVAAVVTPAALVAPVVVAPVPTVAVAVAATTVVEGADEVVNVVANYNLIVEQVNTLRTTLATVFASMKKLEKQLPRELKRAGKGRRRAKAVEGDNTPKKETVFTKPTPISDALCTFLGLPKGSQISRSEVTTRVCRYAREKALMDKQVIKADATLRKLLALKETDELKILNLQRYLKPHYLTASAPAAAAATA